MSNKRGYWTFSVRYQSEMSKNRGLMDISVKVQDRNV